MIGYGWLPRDESLPLERFGVEWRLNEPSTRREEYNILAEILDTLRPEKVLDAGCGWLAHVHMAPYICAASGADVLAVDTDERHLDLPEHHRVERRVHDIFDLSDLSGEFDLGLCISTLEHTPDVRWPEFVSGMAKRICPGGYLYVSADFTPYEVWPDLLEPDFDVGSKYPDPEEIATQRNQPTSYCIARRR